MIIFGENPESGSMNLEQSMIYFIYTLFVNIVMLNLLISILGDSFEQLMTTQYSDDLLDICDMLIEFSQIKRFTNKILCKKSPDSKPQYLHMMT